ERFEEVKRICQAYSLKVIKKTNVSRDKDWDVLILDTIGELTKFYALSDVAFVGGSLVPWGGHNILEPAFYEKPVFFGPNMKNFAFLADRFIQSGAARVIEEEENLLDMFLMKNENELSEMGKKARETLDSLRGATKKTIQEIEAFMMQ
ncbi:MAG: hypothetical protein Q9M37_09785, partial [Desulfonauticus sp.]|nr:hypothetical protein [Desulfonauticus sp.]